MSERLFGIVGHDGVCAICGSRDGQIVLTGDGRYRNICHNYGCKAYYCAGPHEGFESVEDVRNPDESALIKGGCTVGRYLRGIGHAGTGGKRLCRAWRKNQKDESDVSDRAGQ